MFALAAAGHEDGRAAVVRSLPNGLRAVAETIMLRIRSDEPSVDDLSADAARSGGSAAVFWHCVDLLVRSGCVEVLVRSGDQVLLTVAGIAPMLFPGSAGDRLRLSRLASVRRSGTNLLLESANSGANLTIVSDAALELFGHLAFGRPVSSLPDLEADRRAVDEMALCFAVVAGERPEGDHSESNFAQWEHHDALFHARTRGNLPGKRGGTYRFVGVREPTPAAPKRSFGEPLEPPSYCASRDMAVLNRLMMKRRSVRAYGKEPISFAELGAFLQSVARTLEVRPVNEANGLTYETVRRPYPGGGACHELELYPIVNRCAGLERGAYWYDCSVGSFHRVRPDCAVADQILDRSGASMGITPQRPDVLITIAARFGRVNWKYEGIAYALVLKDVGVLLHTMYMVSTAMGLAGCAIGTGDSRHFSALTSLPSWEEDSVGEFALGSPGAVPC